MKNVVFVISLLSVILFSACDKETVLAENKIPAAITSYVATHFPSSKILQTVEDKDGFKKSYDVVLEDNTKLEFNKKYEITAIESTSKLPDSVIPEKILTYVLVNYPNNYIIEWELDGNRQKVELNNKIELEFNKEGDFVRMD